MNRYGRYGDSDEICIRSKRFNMLGEYVSYWDTKHSFISSRKELLKIFDEICKDTNMRVLHLRHRNPLVKNFALNMVKHYGKELLMV